MLEGHSQVTSLPHGLYGPSPRRGTSPFMSLGLGQGLARPELPPGTRLGRFMVKQLLGRGGLGDVYRAEDGVRSQDLAVKMVPMGPCNADVMAPQLQRERRMYDRIHDYRHVLKVHDVHVVRWGGIELLLLSMEYADGGTLREWLELPRDDWHKRRTDGLEYFRQICLGVAAIHDAGLAHLDLKPENILFVYGTLKVSDFNVAAFVQNVTLGQVSGPRGYESDHDAGTPTYMSPEHFAAPHPGDLDTRADIYALGVMLYEILHPKGRAPFGGSLRRLRELHLQAPPPALPEAEEAERRVVSRCLQKSPEERYQTVAELLDDLDGRLAGVEEDITGLAAAPGPVDEAWQQVCRCMEEGMLDDAQRQCRLVLEESPDHVEARQMIETLQERHQRAGGLYAAIESGLESSSLDELAALLVEAVNTYPDHPSGHAIQVRLAVRSEQYRRLMEEAETAVRQGDWESAHTWFEKAGQLDPGAPHTERPLRFVAGVLSQIRDARLRIDQAIAAGNGRLAMAIARDLDDLSRTAFQHE